MNVYVEKFLPDNAISRITNALKKYLSLEHTLTENPEGADFVVVCDYGRRRKTLWYTQKLIEQKKRYAIIQLSVRSTPNPNTLDWLPIWEKAELTWSYYNLPELCREDGNTPNFKFYWAPLGVDAEIFKETKAERRFIIAGTGTGKRWNRECKNEILEAARSVKKTVFQLGTGESSKEVFYSNGMNDTTLAQYYSQCQFVSGLRRIEGFELPVLEGLLCGARPICFDKPHYRKWFNEFAEYIPEDKKKVENLIKLFQKGARPVSKSEKDYVKKNFDWEKICRGFWKLALW
ncbi:MAG: hypothetical protein UT24_C0007G0071 [Candidatus Woesebacteria bacterium GW2011_GWB1_39_12]|uniref:Glycosyl transferase family 1 domain-containing protein n=2 Tax=Candidatus Woeseibacteriota TaxID=1752722 RepID=A0A0G0PJQ0_9BACT|nr:MAG: hypothetical protein UT23_C0004G0150 [Candidatus Woesebacteria bacterium GW2011_GWA1_39_12]KKR01107.1 MAG: hypothetical protein UT24_C0007G0071 [Candidatus Woesebacteria bacterium GW2011_GWB1_39_12]